MPYISVDIDLEDIDTRDLLAELECRYLDDREQLRLMAILKNTDGKTELFFKVQDLFSLFELQELLIEKTTAVQITKEQLQLSLDTTNTQTK